MFGAIRKAKGRIKIGRFVDQTKHSLLQNHIHVSSKEWDDPYLYGYFCASTVIILKSTSDGKLGSGELAEVQAWAWNHLTALPETHYFNRVQTYSEMKSEEFERGADRGFLLGTLLTRTARADAPQVAEAIAAGRLLEKQRRGDLSKHDDLLGAASTVMAADFFEYLRAQSEETRLG